MTLWFDVEDLIVFFQRERRPTGIQRLSFEILREVWRLAGPSGLVQFCRHGAKVADYLVVDWPELEADILAATAAQATGAHDALVAPDDFRRSVRYKIHSYLSPRLNPLLRPPLGAFYRGQKQSLLALRDLCKALATLAARRGTALKEQQTLKATAPSARAAFAPGDIFISLGAAWVLPNAAAVKHVQTLYGLRSAVLIYDLIPDLYPEWTSKEGLPIYRAWLHEIVPHADMIFTISQNTAKDFSRRMAQLQKTVPAPMILPIGQFPAPQRIGVRVSATGQGRAPLLFDRPFVLFVSTIEVRKNHALLFRVWRRLLAEMPAEQVPYLVFAGKIGWLTKDLLVQLDNADWLNGHIKHVQSPSEQELAALYEACAFTVFPSLYEGWGLPVTESLSFGKTVAASNAASIPEAGGAFCSYFDPEALDDAYEVIRGLIENPQRVAEFEAQIAEGFRPPSWADSAASLLRHLQAADAA
jgi:glycosyltransferase involved in cell wall biosynthesis